MHLLEEDSPDFSLGSQIHTTLDSPQKPDHNWIWQNSVSLKCSHRYKHLFLGNITIMHRVAPVK